MNKADEKRLKSDPRYATLMTAATALQAVIADANRRIAETREVLNTVAPGVYATTSGEVSDLAAFEALRPKGDKCRVLTWNGGVATEEIESVTAARVVIGRTEYNLKGGKARGHSQGRIHEDDIARIKAGELQGWRQKPWPKS